MDELFTKRMMVIAMVFLLILAGGTAGTLWFLGQEKAAEPEKAEQKTPDYSMLPPGNGTVIYTDAGFEPREVTLKMGAGFGCVVNLVNRGAGGLKIGISPHDPQKDPGPDWPVIEPGKNFLFDPRFSGILLLRIHDHSHSEREFAIHFSKSCQ